MPHDGRMTDARILLLHGFEHHRAPEHWLWWLAEELRGRRIPVAYPQLPGPDLPLLGAWCEVAEAELAMLGDGERVVITHSLGGILWTHLAARGARVDRVLMVAPPSLDRVAGAMSDMALDHVDIAAALATGAPSTTVVARERDPYRSVSLAAQTAEWPVATVELPGEGHLNPGDGHGPWELPLTWALEGTIGANHP